MKNPHNIIRTALITVAMMAVIAANTVTVIAANAVQPAETKENEAKEQQLYSQAKISLSEAIKAAEQKIGGKAVEAEFDDESDTVQFEVEVLKDGKIHKVMVDGETGHILRVSLDDESNEGLEDDESKESIENEKE